MEWHMLGLVDESGQPFSPHVEDALTNLVARLQSRFPVFRDEFALRDVLEEAGRRIVKREQRSGSIANLRGYAWVTLRSIATSWLRRGSGRLAQETLGSAESEVAIASLPTQVGTPEETEHVILLREILAQLTPEERLVCVWKKAGFSSQQIAAHRRTSVGAINTLFWRTKRKIRNLLGVRCDNARRDAPVGPSVGPDSESVHGDGTDVENLDDAWPRRPRFGRLHHLG
jgi:RNA polymerase sigma factor (sigma-70 family)